MEQKGSRFVLPLLRLRMWLAEKIRFNDLQVTLFHAGLIGFAGGVAMVVFRYASRWLGQLLTGQFGPGEPPSTICSGGSGWAVPTVGGLAAGAFLLWSNRIGRKGATTDYMEAVALGDGVVSFRSSLIKSASALFTVATGGSIGREGPVVALSAMLASGLGRVAAVARDAAAAAGGVRRGGGHRVGQQRASGRCAFRGGNHPGFAGDGEPRAAGVFLGHCHADGSQPVVGNPLYTVNMFQLNHNWEMIPHTLLGLLCGFLAPYYLGFLQRSERLFTGLGAPLPVRLALGGLAVGALSIISPEVCGNGYSAIDALLHGGLVWQGVLLLLALKLLATAATFGSGAVGGVFTPTIFVGACVGYLLGGGLALVFRTGR